MPANRNGFAEPSTSLAESTGQHVVLVIGCKVSLLHVLPNRLVRVPSMAARHLQKLRAAQLDELAKPEPEESEDEPEVQTKAPFNPFDLLSDEEVRATPVIARHNLSVLPASR